MITFVVNGAEAHSEQPADTPLLWVLREELGLTGTKFGCGIAQCGACTVHLDGQPVRACVTPLSAVGTRAIVTIEGVSGPVADAVRTAWTQLDVPQCGYCQPGQIMAGTSLLKTTPHPTDADIDAAMSGNICRCGTYPRIRAALKRAATGAGTQ